MPDFDITSPMYKLSIGADGKCRVQLTVKNLTGVNNLLARADLEPLEGAQATWLSIDGKRERQFKVDGTETFDVAVDTSGAPAGHYGFRVRVSATTASASEYSTASEPFGFEVAPPPPPPVEPPEPVARRDPWAYVAIVLGVLVVVMAIVAIVLFVVG